MDENKNSVVKAISVLCELCFFFLTKVTKHLCLLNLNITFCTKQSTKIGPTPS